MVILWSGSVILTWYWTPSILDYIEFSEITDIILSNFKRKLVILDLKECNSKERSQLSFSFIGYDGPRGKIIGSDGGLAPWAKGPVSI